MAEQTSGHLKNTWNHVEGNDLEELLLSERRRTVSFVVFVYWIITIGYTLLFAHDGQLIPFTCYVTLWTFTIIVSALYLLRAIKLAFLAAGLGAVSLSMFVYTMEPGNYFMGIVQTSVLMTVVATLYFHRVFFWIATATGGAMFAASFIIALVRQVGLNDMMFVIGLNGLLFWLMVSVASWLYLKKSIWLFAKLSDAQSAMMIDALTKTYNRLYFNESLTTLEQRLTFASPNELISILMLDLDHFKHINDDHGHPVGDQVLVHFAEVIQAHIRRTDVFMRVGGEEFALIVHHDHRFDVASYADRLRMAVEQNAFVLTKDAKSLGATGPTEATVRGVGVNAVGAKDRKHSKMPQGQHNNGPKSDHLHDDELHEEHRHHGPPHDHPLHNEDPHDDPLHAHDSHTHDSRADGPHDDDLHARDPHDEEGEVQRDGALSHEADVVHRDDHSADKRAARPAAAQSNTTIFIPLTTSIGGATFMPAKETIHGCVNRADVALYEGKTRGRNRVVIA